MKVDQLPLSGQDQSPPPLPSPFILLAPVFSHLINGLIEKHPGLFERLGDYRRKRYLIDAGGLPFVLLLKPDKLLPSLTPYSRDDVPEHDAVIRGPLMKLVDLVSGKQDGDALFFSRELVIEGDTEAVVALRNTIDDMDIDLVREIENMLGPAGSVLRLMRHQAEDVSHLLHSLRDKFLAPAFERTDKLEREIKEIKKDRRKK